MRDFFNQKPSLLILVGIALAVQIITAFTAIGYFHPDQHFQIVEPSSMLTSQDENFQEVWEFETMIRPTLAIYGYYYLRELTDFFGVSDAFSEQLVGRIIVSLLSFFLSFLLLFRALRDNSDFSRLLGVLLLGFAWVFPYTRTMLSSENFSLIFLVVSIYLLIGKNKNHKIYFLSGTLMAVAFYLRFQIAFALVGIFLALIFEEKWIKKFTYLALGFGLVAILNTLLDSSFYGQFVLTPWNYFEVNIIEGVAASFGVQGPLYYPMVILLILGAPLISILFLAFVISSCWKNPKSYIVLSVLLFLFGHTLVGHKEERFLVPIFSLLPILVAQGFDYLKKPKGKAPWLKVVLWIILVPSIILNTFLLFVFMVMPYHQNLSMAQKISKEYTVNDKVEIFCLRSGPFQTPSDLMTRYYENSFPKNIKLTLVENIDEIPDDRSILLATKYKFMRNQEYFSDNNQLTPILYSNRHLLNFTQWIEARTKVKIDDAWVLYEIEQ